MLGSDFKDAMRRWDIEVEAEATELIESGTPPYEAIEQAKNIVSRRRRDKAGAEKQESQR